MNPRPAEAGFLGGGSGGSGARWLVVWRLKHGFEAGHEKSHGKKEKGDGRDQFVGWFVAFSRHHPNKDTGQTKNNGEEQEIAEGLLHFRLTPQNDTGKREREREADEDPKHQLQLIARRHVGILPQSRPIDELASFFLKAKRQGP